MDKYDYMILDIIHTYKQEQQSHIRLAVLERNFWKRIEADTDLSVGQARIGERITNLYLDGMLQNKNGYTLTKKGREQLAFAPWKQTEIAWDNNFLRIDSLHSEPIKKPDLIRLFYFCKRRSLRRYKLLNWVNWSTLEHF